jgi:RNA polymerase sigma-70 factor (ECF subfamily)
MWSEAAQERGKQAVDEHAFTLLIDSHLPGAYRLAYGMLGSTADAEDAVQEAALRAWRSFGRFRKDAEIRPWLYTIVANECRSHLRRLRRRNDDLQISDAASHPTFTDPEMTDLRRALDRLPTDQRLLIVLRYYLDLPFQEVAAMLRISPKAARSRTYRALERLRLMPEVLPDE